MRGTQHSGPVLQDLQAARLEKILMVQKHFTAFNNLFSALLYLEAFNTWTQGMNSDFSDFYCRQL